MAATIRDIKRMTGLSLATVSKYLNGGNVLPENKAAIEHAIEVLHYEVNEVARGLATNRTKTIGVLIQRLDNLFSSTIISKIEDILRGHGYGTIICDCKGEEKLEEESIRFLLSKRVDGIITLPTATSSGYLERALVRDIPVILIDRVFEDKEWDSIQVDNEEGGKMAVQKLIENGHTKIAIVCGDEQYYTAKKRLKGYFDALEEADLPVYSKYIKRGPLETSHGFQSVVELMEMEDPPTAVFLSNYEITLGAMLAINERDIKVPEDLSVVGFDNMLLAQVVKPKLWMVVQPMEEIAREAAELMLRKLDGGTEEGQITKVVLHTSLTEGASIKKIGKLT